MSDYSELKRLSEAATPGPWVKTIDGVMPEGEKFGIFGNFGANNGEANRGFIAAANPAAVLALISEVEQLKADLQGELSAAKEDARRQRADQIAYRAAVYRLKREAPGEVVGGARLQRLFLISNDNAQILLSAMKERGDLVEIKEKPWGGMVPSTNSEILGDQP